MQRVGPTRRCVQPLIIGIFSRQICGDFSRASVRVQKLLSRADSLSSSLALWFAG
jgi:hypothetical protein